MKFGLQNKSSTLLLPVLLQSITKTTLVSALKNIFWQSEHSFIRSIITILSQANNNNKCINFAWFLIIFLILNDFFWVFYWFRNVMRKNMTSFFRVLRKWSFWCELEWYFKVAKMEFLITEVWNWISMQWCKDWFI